MFKQFNKYRDAEGDEEYLGNIWGWKVSYIGLGIIVFFLALYLYRINTLSEKQVLPSTTIVEKDTL